MTKKTTGEPVVFFIWGDRTRLKPDTNNTSRVIPVGGQTGEVWVST